MSHTHIRRYLKHGMLPQLTVFEAVARLGNFTKAGEELFMAQPTVSVQMKKLAETIGTPLVEQIGKRIYLTEAGKTLYVSCHEIFSALNNLNGQLSGLQNLDNGLLHIAVSTTAKDFAPRMLREFSKLHPDVRLHLQIENRQGLLKRLAENTDDLYIFDLAPREEEFSVVTQRILPNPMVALAAPDHALAGQKNIPLERLAQEPFIMREQGSGTRLVVDELFAEHGLAPTIRMELSSNDMIREAIHDGLGVSILSRYTLAKEASRHDLVILDAQSLPVENHWVFAYPVGKQLSSMAEKFMTFARHESKLLALSYRPGH